MGIQSLFNTVWCGYGGLLLCLQTKTNHELCHYDDSSRAFDPNKDKQSDCGRDASPIRPAFCSRHKWHPVRSLCLRYARLPQSNQMHTASKRIKPRIVSLQNLVLTWRVLDIVTATSRNHARLVTVFNGCHFMDLIMHNSLPRQHLLTRHGPN